MSWIIRQARYQNLKQVFSLIKEFAKFEKLSHEVTLTAEEFESDGQTQLYQCLVAEDNCTLVGYALFFPVYSGFQGKQLYLEDIYVVPNMRGKGLGKALYDAVIQESASAGQGRLRFACLEWNKRAVEFYNNSGAENLTAKVNLHCYRFDKAQLSKLLDNKKGTAMMAGVCIRKGLRTDVPKMFPLTKDFAKYLKLEHTMTLQELEDDGFGNSPRYQCLVAERQEEILGYALYYSAYSTFQGRCLYLEELYVRDDVRKNGLGRGLLHTLTAECIRTGCCKMQFVSEPPAGSFYRKMGATNLTEEQQWIYFLLSQD